MERTKEIFLAGFGIIFGALAKMLGGWDHILQALIICMSVDYVSGIILAGVFKKSPKSPNGALESKAGFLGLWRKGMMLLLVVVAHYLDIATQMDFVRDCVIYGVMANEVISIIENAGLMGIPVPKALSKAIDILASKEKVDNK